MLKLEYYDILCQFWASHYNIYMLFVIARLVPVARYVMPVPKDFKTCIAHARPCPKGQCLSVPVPKKYAR